MPPLLALILTLAFIGWLFRTDRRQIRAPAALLVPGIWFAIVGSRSPAEWLNPNVAGVSDAEGGPINLIFYCVIMIAALSVLKRRGLDWGAFAANNKALCALYAYFAASGIWSEIHLGAVQRIVKDFSTVLAALVILTEADPFAAARLVFVRVSFVLFPMSVCLIKYFPSLGRMTSKSWELMYNGVAMHKNSLGALTFVTLLMLAIDVVELRKKPPSERPVATLRIRYLMIAIGIWLMFVCDSKTSLLCTVIGLAMLWAGKRIARMPHPGRAFGILLALLAVGGILQSTLGVSDLVFRALGRNSSLTGRDGIWEMVGQQHVNPLLGCGYLTFWDSAQARAWREVGGTEIVSTHNGYLEVFVDGGGIGVLLLATLLISQFRQIIRALVSGTALGIARLMFIVPILIYNWSESAYFRLGAVWFTAVLVLINLPPAAAECVVPDWAKAKRLRGEEVHA